VGGQLLKLQGLGGAYDEVFLPVHGAHQAGNAAVALAAAEALLGAGGDRQLDIDAVRAGFASVTAPGRLERVRTAPAVLVDAAHNPHGVRALAAAVSDEFGFSKLVGVLAVLRDKDALAMLQMLEPVLDEVVVTRNSSPRALDVDELAGLAVQAFGADRVVVEPRLDDAVEEAVRLAEETDGESEALGGGGVLITGSVVTAGDARLLFGKDTV
jgi:dihydrofolate synthase/folylpolyglutamate synthase